MTRMFPCSGPRSPSRAIGAAIGVRRALRTAMPWLVSLAGWLAIAAADATDLTWDGNSYLPVPVRLGSDTRLIMPEPFDDAWERESEVATVLLDARTLIIRPRSASIEQRLTLRGRKSGTLYLARVSTALPYAPIVTVNSNPAQQDDPPSGRLRPTVVGLLKAMMQGNAPAGYQVLHSQRVLLDQPPYRIVAQQVWRSRHQTGILAQLSTSLPGQTIPVVPANILVRVPELGTLRAMAADDFELNANRLSTRVYLVYAR
jgi:hypothetical protein